MAIESQVVIVNSQDNTEICGVLRGSPQEKSVVFVPGLGGRMNGVLPYMGARALESVGYSSLSIALCGDGQEQRNIQDMTVQSIASDIDASVEYLLQQGSPAVGVIGHSLGGMAILYSKQQAFKAAVLWDPSHTDRYLAEGRSYINDRFVFVPELNAYASAYGNGHVYPKGIFDATDMDSGQQAQELSVRTLVINADRKAGIQSYGRAYADDISAPTNYAVIPNTDHNFTTNNGVERLLNVTLPWIQEHL